MANEVTFSPEALQRVIAEAVAQALAARDAAASQAGKPRAAEKSTTVDDKTDRALQMDIAVVKAFKRAGFKNAELKPRINILTYRRWAEDHGRKVIPGEKSVKCGAFRLFHVSQTIPINPDAKDEAPPKAEANPNKAKSKLGLPGFRKTANGPQSQPETPKE